MDDRDKRFPPPKTWQRFEDLCHRLFGMVLADPLIQKNGRQGQAQNGVDLFGSPNANYSVFWGIQCKVEPPGRSSDSILANVKQEVDKAESFEPKLEHWIFSTTAPVDAVLQRDARNLSQARARDGLFTLSVLGWDEIVSLLCTHADVMAEFYPGHGVNIKEILQELQQLPNAQEVHELLNAVRRMADRDSLGDVGTPAWRTVVFDESRDLGPALMGRSLGPRDVTACPTLPEAIAAIEDLKRAYGTRLVGPPGSGKSICMYQAAHHFAINDWQVLQLASPRTSVIDLHAADLRHPTLFLIDDAHLTEAHALQEAEDTAGPNHLLLSTHNSVGHDTASRGAIVVDQKRAVRTIATTLRADLQRTLEAVSRVDDRVGRRPLDESIEHRIGEAERAAEFPWQFCFVLGGGWRRATDRVTAARGAEADICLAGVAIHQIASRDARPDLRELLELLIVSDLDARQVHSSLRWLIRERLVIGSHDLRCPHQRFAMVALTTVLEGRDAAGRDRIGKLLQHFVKGSDYPLAGHYFLLQTLRLADSRRWTYLLPEESLEPLVRRCWHAATPELRNFASLVLSELQSYVRGWPGAVFDGNEQTFSGWISDPRSPSGHGLALALHAVRARDDALARALVEESSAREVAKAVSHATPETAYGLGELLGALHPDPSAPWGHALLTALDRQRLVSLARHWPAASPAWAFAKLCRAISATDEALGLKMVDGFSPMARKLLSTDPISAFRDLRDVVHHVLRMVDVLGIYRGKRAPTAQHRRLARGLVSELNVRFLARQLSAARLRDFQCASYLLQLSKEATPRKFRATVSAMDWQLVGETIGDQWKDLPHDAEVLLHVGASVPACQAEIARVVMNNVQRIESFPPRLVLFAPEAAVKHVQGEGAIRLAHHGHVAWYFGVPVLAWFYENHRDLLVPLLKPSLAATARSLSEADPSWYRKAAPYIELLGKTAPRCLQRVLDGVVVEGAERGWSASLRAGGGPRRAAALLVASSLSRADGLGDLARELRKRFPKSSVPQGSSLSSHGQ